MEPDRDRWNEKYRDRPHAPDGPAAALHRFFHLAPSGNALDIAAGTGANSLFLATRGYKVDAVDISDEAIARMPRHPNLTRVRADLDRYDPPENRYDLIINFRFLNRRLFPGIQEALRPGGLLIFETFATAPDGTAAAPHRREFLLRPNELLHAFIGLHVLYYEETLRRERDEDIHMATLAARRQK